MKKLLLISLLFSFAFSASVYGQRNKPISCLVKGDMTGSNATNVYVLPYDKDPRFDGGNIPLTEGKFEYTLKVDTMTAYQLLLPSQTGFFFVDFFPEAEGVEIVYDPQKQRVIATSKGANNMALNAYDKEQASLFQARLDSIKVQRERLNTQGKYLSEEVNAIKQQWDQTDDRAVQIKLREQVMQFEKDGKYYSPAGYKLDEESKQIGNEQDTWTRGYLAKNPNLANLYRLISKTKNAVWAKKDVATWIGIYDRHYAKVAPGHPFHATMEGYRQSLKMVAGAKYIDTTLPDTEGRATKLSEVIDGKIALIDLWASWCASCRKHSTSVIPVYEKYKDKGFTVVGVAREYKNDKAWRSALARDGYPWRNLIEIDNCNNLWPQYGVTTSAGASFLVDRDGTVLAVNPTAEEIEAILQKKL